MSAGEKIEPDRQTTDIVWQRVWAQIVDIVMQICLAIIVLSVIVLVLDSVSGPVNIEAIEPLFYFLTGGTWLAYNVILEGYWNGQTVGKRLLGIKVVNPFGREPAVSQAFVRNIPSVFGPNAILYAAGLAFIASNNFHRRLFDQFADTSVVDIS